jgi:hypothetical protein
MLAMSNETEKWRELAAKASKESDPKKLMDLVQRLNTALIEKEKSAMRSHESRVA